jgi:hypothetical protein
MREKEKRSCSGVRKCGGTVESATTGAADLTRHAAVGECC